MKGTKYVSTNKMIEREIIKEETLVQGVNVKEPLLSIIIPVYGIKEEYLRKCVDSLLDQSREEYKIILVDDGSPDNCGDICEEYAARNNSISVIHQENQGAAVARNSGIDLVNTKWLAFVDADDWVERDYIDTILTYITGDAVEADILMFSYIRENISSSTEENINLETGYFPERILEQFKKAAFFHCYIQYVENGKKSKFESMMLWNKVYRVEFLKSHNIRFVAEARKGQDRIFNAEALTLVSGIFYIDKPMYHYRCTETSRTNRYDPRVPELTTIELKGIQSVIERYNLDNTIKDYFNCSVSTRLYSCMRLCYFHSSNRAPYKERVNDLKALIASEPYKSSLKNVKMSLLNLEEKIFVYCIKLRLYRICSLLVKARNGRTKKTLR